MSATEDLEVDATGRFIPALRCNCGPEHFFSQKVCWEEVPMTESSFGGKAYLTTAFERYPCILLCSNSYQNLAVAYRSEPFSGPYDPGVMHHVVEVVFECNRCGHLFARIYEHLRAGKFARDG